MVSMINKVGLKTAIFTTNPLTRFLALFPFPKIGNGIFIPVQQVGNAIYHSRSQNLGMGSRSHSQKSFPLTPESDSWILLRNWYHYIEEVGCDIWLWNLLNLWSTGTRLNTCVLNSMKAMLKLFDLQSFKVFLCLRWLAIFRAAMISICTTLVFVFS